MVSFGGGNEKALRTLSFSRPLRTTKLSNDYSVNGLGTRLMRNLLSLILVLCLVQGARGGSSLGEARKRLLKGNYAEAQQLYERLLKEPKRAVAAAVGLNKALQSQGEYDAALKVLDEALRERP